MAVIYIDVPAATNGFRLHFLSFFVSNYPLNAGSSGRVPGATIRIGRSVIGFFSCWVTVVSMLVWGF